MNTGIRRELAFAFGPIVLLSTLLAFGAIGVLARMGPAIEQILTDNTYSMDAAEEILHELAGTEGWPPPPDNLARIDAALTRAENNVTEPLETETLARMRSVVDGTEETHPRAALADAAFDLIAINRDAIEEADREAQRLSMAGAWAAVFIGAITFAVGLLLYGRLSRRLSEPLVELATVCESVEASDPHRRCRAIAAPLEITRAMKTINGLLDERRHDGPEHHQLIDRGLSAALASLEGSAAIVDGDGDVVRTTARSLELLHADEGDLHERLRALAGGDQDASDALRAQEIGDKAGWLVFLEPREV